MAEQLKQSVGRAYLIYDDELDPCQVWVGSEQEVEEHCFKYGFSWEYIHIFETEKGIIKLPIT